MSLADGPDTDDFGEPLPNLRYAALPTDDENAPCWVLRFRVAGTGRFLTRTYPAPREQLNVIRAACARFLQVKSDDIPILD